MPSNVSINRKGPLARRKTTKGLRPTRRAERTGTPQYIGARLSAPHRPRQLRLQFQGGFVGADCWLEAGPAPDQLHRLHAFYPDNINRLQTFDVDCPHPVTHVKVVFNGSTDFFGRVVVYRFDLLADAEDSVDGQPVG
ncbi:nuclear receptor 2C2-associated protein-like isoform X7 [Pollicipes pollicipes]|uniref:nuclear receptor 2C2-associated protein-like isoform X7 n=1 Tax=Pollicipes pollicipes TaxID=41117 RepID=UPI0018851E79|nr:nuclear receptor 2C2-associated protein-like isoform X7 [Pollicipes pollicipes]